MWRLGLPRGPRPGQCRIGVSPARAGPRGWGREFLARPTPGSVVEFPSSARRAGRAAPWGPSRSSEAESGGGARGVVRDETTGDLRVVTVTPENESRILVHDAHATSPTTAFALSRLADPDTLHHTPIGVFRSVERPVYDTQMADQLDTAIDQFGKGDLTALLAGKDTWTVGRASRQS